MQEIERMKRYIPFIGMIVFIAAVLWAGVYIQQERQQQLAAREMYEKERHLVVYSDMPGQVNQDLAAAFYKDTGLRAYIMTMTEDELQRAIRNPKENQLPDAVIASEDTLYAGRLQGAFIPYTSYITDEVPHELKDDAGAWIGLWYDPLVFVINRDYYNMGGSNINTWSDLLTDANMVISFPDLAATDIAGSFLCEYVELHGQERAELYFRSLQTRIGAYSKTMAPVMHRVAGGEAQAGVVDAVTAGVEDANDGAQQVAGKGVFGDFWLQNLGLRNVAEETQGFAQTSFEQIYGWNPELLFLNGPGISPIRSEEVLNNTVEGADFSSLDAVKNKRVYNTTLGMWSWFTPNPDAPLVYAWLACCAYPEAFRDYPLKEKIRDYYSRFYGYDLNEAEIEEMLEY